MNAPLKPKHELFAQRVATGDSATAAYRAVYGTGKNADVFGPRLMGNDGIRARVGELQAGSANAITLTMQERREMLAAAARSPEIGANDLVKVLLADAKLSGELKGNTVNVTQAVQVPPPDKLMRGLAKFLLKGQADATRARLPVRENGAN